MDSRPPPSIDTVVPYITTRIGEELGIGTMLRSHPTRGLYYDDEVPSDRDLRGVLWVRRGQNPRDNQGQPTGVPRFSKVHPGRQRDVMYRLRCQVCCQRPASRTELGYLFLLERPVSRTEDGWPEGVLTPHPPLCLAHAGVSVERCPPLRKGHVAVRATRPRLYGVRGLVLTPGWTQMLHVLPDDPDDEEAVAYQSPRARWCLATQQVRRLCGVTVIDLEAELAAAGLGR